MKYCQKCGNQLFDEAVICPQCGCPQEQSKGQRNPVVAVLGILAAIGIIVVTILLAIAQYNNY